MLKAKKPQTIQKRLKALFYGVAGSGKTMAAIQFPNAYLIDTERGAENDQYIKLLEKNNSVIFQTQDFYEIMGEIKSLLSEKHSYKTLIIDSLTPIFHSLASMYLPKVGDGFAKHYQEAGKDIAKMINLLLRLDMNVIITSHSKVEYGANMAVLGETFDSYKKLDYLFDLALEINIVGKKRMATVRKSRISGFEDNEKFDFSYTAVANKYGRESIEEKVKEEKLATEEQLEEFYQLCDILLVKEEEKKRWLTKGMASTFEDMNFDHIDKIIASLKSKIKQEDIL